MCIAFEEIQTCVLESTSSGLASNLADISCQVVSVEDGLCDVVGTKVHQVVFMNVKEVCTHLVISLVLGSSSSFVDSILKWQVIPT